MTNQIQGEILYAGVIANPVYTPWMPVRGDIATFGVQVIQVNGTDLEWLVETRTLEDPTPSEVFTTQTVSTVVVDRFTSSTVSEELVRYKFKTTGAASTTNFVVFRALQPSWQTDR